LRLHRVYTDQGLKPDTDILLQGLAVHYLSRVLRVSAGQSLVLFNGDGSDYSATVIAVQKLQIQVQILQRTPARPESPLQITLVQALARGERMDQLLRRATELGVAAFQPVFSERVEVRIRPEKLEKRMEHWRNIVISACEQCGRAVVPTVSAPLNLVQWLGQAGNHSRLILEPGADTPLSGLQMGNQVELLVGPEGGFTERELACAKEQGVQAVSLGPRILRTETAGPAACAVLQAQAGDFR
jgi:16S rRNA (uracil1498-N3)-methyltransferase